MGQPGNPLVRTGVPPRTASLLAPGLAAARAGPACPATAARDPREVAATNCRRVKRGVSISRSFRNRRGKLGGKQGSRTPPKTQTTESPQGLQQTSSLRSFSRLAALPLNRALVFGNLESQRPHDSVNANPKNGSVPLECDFRRAGTGGASRTWAKWHVASHLGVLNP